MKYYFILISFLSIFYACSNPGKPKLSKTDAVSEKISRSIDSFENRTIHKKLTIDIINNTPDDQLLQVVFDNLSSKIPENYEREFETVLTFSKPQQAIYVIWNLEAEVNNGGFNQYYFNSSGQFSELTPPALKLVGANKFAELTIRANKIYKAEADKINKHNDGTIEGFSKSYENNPLNPLDDEFYALPEKEDLSRLQIDFIRKNKEAFIN